MSERSLFDSIPVRGSTSKLVTRRKLGRELGNRAELELARGILATQTHLGAVAARRELSRARDARKGVRIDVTA